MHKRENLLTIWTIMTNQESFKQTMIHYIALIKIMDNNTVLANFYYLPARQNRHIAPATFSIAPSNLLFQVKALNTKINITINAA